MRTLALAIVPLFMLACGQEPPTSASPLNLAVTESTDEMYRLVGQGSWYDGTDPDIVIQAIRHFDGRVTGEVRDPRYGTFGPVVGVTPPSVAYPFWCVAVNLLEDPGVVALVYVRDNDGSTALDELGYNGDYGASCAQYPAPAAEFNAILSGDFQGVVRAR